MDRQQWIAFDARLNAIELLVETLVAQATFHYTDEQFAEFVSQRVRSVEEHPIKGLGPDMSQHVSAECAESLERLLQHAARLRTGFQQSLGSSGA